MWVIVNIVNNTSQEFYLSGRDQGPIVGVQRGPEGASYRIIVIDKGMLDLVDIGWGASDWGIDMNGSRYGYQGEGKVTLTFNDNSTFQATGDGNNITGDLKPLPKVSGVNAAILTAMHEIGMVPYPTIPPDPPGAPGSNPETAYGYFKFAGKEMSTILYYAVRDWKSPNFYRCVIMSAFRYTGISQGQPLDFISLPNVIFKIEGGPYNAQNPEFMWSGWLMSPANDVSSVAQDLQGNNHKLYCFNEAENDLISTAFYALPRTSVHNQPMLYSGQPDINSISMDQFSAEFLECPANNGPTTSPIQLPFEEALQTIFKPGSTITSKNIISFTSYRDRAIAYSNGILFILSPPAGAVLWEKVTYITEFIGDDKDEYTVSIGSQFYIKDVKQETFPPNGKQLCVFYVDIK